MNILRNPVFRKELLLRVRSWRFVATIIAYNAILSMITLFVFTVSFNSNYQGTVEYTNALVLYGVMSAIQFALVLFLVPVFTAGSIAGERERQTLDILLTTKMRPSQIVIGKMMSSIAMVLLLGITSLPIIAVVFSVGGITMKDLLQLELLLVVTAIYIGSLGVLGSAIFKRTVLATVFTYAGTIALCFASYMIIGMIYMLEYFTNVRGAGIMSVFNTDTGFVMLLLLVSPVMSISKMLSGQFGGSSAFSYIFDGGANLPEFIVEHWFSISMVVQLVIAVLFLLLASKCLDPLRKRKYKEKKRKKRSVQQVA